MASGFATSLASWKIRRALLVHVPVIGVGPQTVFVGILLLMLCTITSKRRWGMEGGQYGQNALAYRIDA